MEHGLLLSGSGNGNLAGCCECGNEPLGSIKRGKFLTSERPISFWRRILFHGVNWSDTGSVFASRSSAFPYQYHSTVAAWSIIYPSPTVL